ncbi:hypothetical protein [Halorarum salinum]|uniref:Rhomboid family intramembrane serine protease n=1 Tax=Halorarum salinum TaxID=2743089 RepID=A0A7D5QH58_9EURY|nr:hypothetical protein [Halobaculum salinum]QLG62004.1 hypothetical protein HUG12_09825 [Halobaculum salinum]
MTLSRDARVSPRHVAEGLLLLSIPVILASIYYWTSLSFQNGLALDHTAPRWYAFWTNSLVHDHRPGDGHLLNNIGIYLILIIPCWLLYRVRNVERRFWTGLLLMLTVGPLIVSGSSYIAYNEIVGLSIQNDRGFSGVVGAIDGFLLVSVLQTIADEQEEPIAMLSLGLFFGYIFAWLGATTSRIGALALGVGIWVVTYASTFTEYVAAPGQLSQWAENNFMLSVLLVCAAFVSVHGFAIALPPEIVSSSGGLINIVSHGAGILFGMATHIGVRYIDLTDVESPVMT